MHPFIKEFQKNFTVLLGVAVSDIELQIECEVIKKRQSEFKEVITINLRIPTQEIFTATSLKSICSSDDFIIAHRN